MNKKFIDDQTKKRVTNLTIKWCKDFFGINERKRTKLKINYSLRKRKIKNAIVFGDYCFYRNLITLYLPHCSSINDVISTTIHEYTHYLQSRSKYKDYEQYYYYSTHPCEREARRNEERYTGLCLKEIKGLL